MNTSSHNTRLSSILTLLAVVVLTPLCVTASSPMEGRATIGGVDDPMAIVEAYLDTHAREMGLGTDDLVGLVVTDSYASGHTGVTHVYLEQRHDGIEIADAMISFNILPDGSVLSVGDRLQRNLRARVRSAVEPLTAIEAIDAAATGLGLPQPEEVVELTTKADGDEKRQFTDGGISLRPIPARKVYQPTASGELREAWEVEIETRDANHSWVVRIDAETGELLGADDLVAWDSYRVYPYPVESPIHTTPLPPADARVLVVDPALSLNTPVSPFGWHDTDNAPGAEETTLRGNNAWVYEDMDGNNVPPAPGDLTDCGVALVCDFGLDLFFEPDSYVDAAGTNAFYWVNLAHDVLYTYGFDEPAGNLQLNNYGRGGAENDRVNVEIQDSVIFCDANFSLTVDGVAPRMQLTICNQTSPARDATLDTSIVVHEYTHGLSGRLAGGPATSSCLTADEMAKGEGWSDFFALAFTMEPGDQAADPRTVFSYFKPVPSGNRPEPYSTDFNINDYGYDQLSAMANEHQRGFIWATMLWEMLWRLVEAHWFNPNIDEPWSSGGNNLAMQLVVDGLKIQDCDPGFVDARDGILWADVALTTGQNACTIWSSFARRGLGESSDQGDPFDPADGTPAYDVPSECMGLELVSDADPICVGQPASYTLRATDLFASAPVDLSVPEPPFQTTVGFSVNPLTAPLPRETELIITDTGNLGAGTSVFRVDGDDGALWNGLELELVSYDSVPPDWPDLVAPVDGLGGVALKPNFDWDPVAQATAYVLEIATEPSFASPVYQFQTTGGTHHRPTITLEPGTLHYWRVRSANPCGVGGEPPFRQFTTAAEIVLVSPENQPLGTFGSSVAMDGDTVVVGAPHMTGLAGIPDGGRVFVFARNQMSPDHWGLVATLYSSSVEVGHHFGSSVAISGDTIVVGTPGANDDSGQAEVFERNRDGADGWGRTATLTIQDSRHAGWSVDIDGHTIVVGAPDSDFVGAAAGAAAVFKTNEVAGWDLIKEILPPDASPEGDRFGWAVAISHDRVAVGAPFDDDNGLDSGSVSLFERNHGGTDNWGELGQIVDIPDADPASDLFGASVALDNDALAVGSPLDEDQFGGGTGTVSIYERNTGGADSWGRVREVWATDRIIGDRFGAAVALRRQTLVVGAPDHDAIGSNTGAAFIFERNHDPTNPGTSVADNWGQIAKLAASNAGEYDGYGNGVAVDRGRVVVGAPNADWESQEDAGVTYLVERGVDRWVEIAQTVEPGSPWTGEAAAIDGETALVGIPGIVVDGGSFQSAPIFSRNQGGGDGWGKVADLEYSFIDGEYSDVFGQSVDISGDTAVVGDSEFCSEEQLDGGVPCWDTGAAFVFKRNTGGAEGWGEVARLLPTIEPEYSLFGASVAIDGDRVIVGAPETLVDGEDYAGMAYLFERNQGGADAWELVSIIDAGPFIQVDAEFGTAVAVSGDLVAVSAPFEDGPGSYGAVYVFGRNQGGPNAWGLVTRFTQPDGPVPDDFGLDLDLDRDTLVVGGYGVSPHVFERNEGGADNWGLVRVIAPAIPDGLFGASVAIDGDLILVGRVAVGGVPPGWLYSGGPVEIRERNQGGADNWGFVGSLEPSGGFQTYTFFGTVPGSVSLDGRTAVVSGSGFEGPVPLAVGFVFRLEGSWPDAPPASLIFADGFEGGNSSRWSSTIP